METNCKELEYIRDNLLTEQKFEEMNTRYKSNPLLRFFRDINRCPGYRELSLIGKWLKALQGIPGLDKVEKDLVKAEEKYWHARLQLNIAASIERNANSKVVALEPEVHLFNWDNVPGNDTGKLINFLKKEFSIDWAEYAKIYKSDDEKTIRIFRDENSAEITLNGKKRATLKIDDDETTDLKVKEKNGKLNLYRNRKPDIHANIKGNEFYIEITTKKELKAFSKYQNMGSEIREKAKRCNLNVYVNINNLQTLPGEKEIKHALKKVDLKIFKGDLPITVRENNFTLVVKEGNSPNTISLTGIKCETGDFQPFGYQRKFAEVVGTIIHAKSAQLPTNLPGFIVIASGMGSYLNSICGINVKVEIQNRFMRLYLFDIDVTFDDELSNGVISGELKDKFKTKGFSLSEIAIVTKEKENEWVITDEEKFIFRKEDGKLKIYKMSNYCPNVLGLGFISKGYGVEAGGEETNFEFIENPFCNYNSRINIKDIVDSLTETWHIDSACLERYRDLFAHFYEEELLSRGISIGNKT